MVPHRRIKSLCVLTVSLISTATSFVSTQIQPSKVILIVFKQKKCSRNQRTGLLLAHEEDNALRTDTSEEFRGEGLDSASEAMVVGPGDINDTTEARAVANQEGSGDMGNRRIAAPKTKRHNDEDDRGGALRKVLQSFSEVGNPDASIPVGSTVVAGLSVPTLGIFEWQSYELISVYDQTVDEVTGLAVKLPRNNLNEGLPIPDGYERYVTLYSNRYHEQTGPVTVSPEEIGLTSFRDEVVDSLLQAFPIFCFWTALAFSFATRYNERYGGNFIDAFFRT